MLDGEATEDGHANGTPPGTGTETTDAEDHAEGSKFAGSESARSEPGGSDGRTIGKDDAFHLLQNSRRRAVLRYLLARPDRPQFPMRDLAEAIAAWEHDTTVRELSSDQRQRVYIALYQSHLPKLDELDVIDYNQSRGIVEPTPLLAVFASFLETGLHADTQELTVEDSVAAPGEAAGEASDRKGVVTSLSSLFAR